MQQDTITFQMATHYLPKVALRLECLFLTMKQACEEVHPVIHHYALKNTIEIIKLIEKPELKSRFLKEFMRVEHGLNKTPTDASNPLYKNLSTQVQFLNHVAGRFGGTIHSDPFLQSIRLSQTTHSSECEYHTPHLLLWLESEPEKRKKDLANWLNQLRSLFDTVSIYLLLLRDAAVFNTINLYNGFYQHTLPSRPLCHLILLRMDKNSGIVPKMQLGHHGLSLRLCESNSMHELYNTNTAVELAICQL